MNKRVPHSVFTGRPRPTRRRLPIPVYVIFGLIVTALLVAVIVERL